MRQLLSSIVRSFVTAGTCLRILPVLLPVILLTIGQNASAVQIIHVAADASSGGNGTSWSSAYQSLSVALAAANPSENNRVEIWLKVGTYKPTTGTNREETFQLRSNVTLRGGFIGFETQETQRPAAAASHTILSGDIGGQQTESLTPTTPLNDLSTIKLNRRPTNASNVGGDPARDNSYNVLSATAIGGVLLDRLVIANGCAGEIDPAPGSQLTATQKEWKQIIESQLTPNADEYARIRTNDSHYLAPADRRVNGGGLFMVHSSVEVRNCVFAANYSQGSGGGIMAYGSNLVLTSSTFAANKSDYSGGAVAITSTNIFAVDTIFYGNDSMIFGGGLYAQTTAFPRNVEGDLYGKSSHAGRSRLYQAQVLLALASSSVGGLLDQTIPVPNDVYGEARVMAAGLGVAKTIVAKVVTGVAKSANAAVSSFGTISVSAQIGSSLSLVYGAVSLAVLVGDIGTALAVYFGVDEYNVHVRNWTAVSNAFNTYLSPLGWAKLLGDLFEPPPNPLQRRYTGRMEDYKTLQNKGTKQTFRNLVFEKNFTGGMGGGLMVSYMNVALGHSKFIGNRALFTGGAAAFVTYNRTDIENSLFQENISDRGTSALTIGFRSEVRALNNAFIRNQTHGPGSAVSVETGADLTLGNSVLWGNTSGDLANATNPFRNGGADVRADRQADLQGQALDEFNKASDESKTQWFGTCDIQYSCVQGLDTLQTGNEVYYYYNSNYDLPDRRGNSLENGTPNIGDGIRPSVKTSRNNFSKDPVLLNNFLTHPLSPLVDAGSPDMNLRLDQIYDLVGNFRKYRNGAIDIGPVENDGNLPGSTILYVNAAAPAGGNGLTWATAYKYLPDALAAPLAPGGQIWVAQGTYYPTKDNNRNTAPELRPGVTLIGGFASGAASVDQSDPVLRPTVLSGAIGTSSANDNSKTLLTGLTEPQYGPEWDGNPRAYQQALSIPRCIRNFTFSSAYDGPAVNLVTPVVVTNCTFSRNHGGRALTINRSLKLEQIAAGGRVTDSLFEHNTGGAMLSTTFAMEVLRCGFYQNEANVGGAIQFHRNGTNYSLIPAKAKTRIERTIFSDNRSTAGRGGAVAYDGESLEILHCVFNGNFSIPAADDSTTTQGGAGLWLSTRNFGNLAQVRIINSIFYYNRLQGSFAPTTIERQQIGLPVYPGYFKAPAPVFLGNSIEGLSEYAELNGAGGNMDYAPDFANPSNRNFTLQLDSVLLNRGADQQSSTDSTTVVGGRDIGASENPVAVSPRPIVPIDFTTPQPTDQGRTYVFKLPSYASGMSALTWQVRRPGGSFQNVSDAYTTGNGTATLTLTNPPHTWNGSIYRVRFHNTDGLTTYSENRTLVCLPSYLYVKQGGSGAKNGTSWADAMPSVQGALQLAAPFTQVWIAAGTYQLPPTVPASGSRIHGGFAGTETTLAQRVSGANETQLVSGSSQRMITYYGAVANPTVLDRLTLVGYHTGSGYNIESLVRFQDADVSVSDVRFKDSYPISVSVGGGNLRLTGCTISGGGDMAMDARNATVSIKTTTFTNNGNRGAGAQAGAIYSSDSTLTIEDSTFTQNLGIIAGGIYSRDGGSVDIRRSRFTGNTGTTGAGGALCLKSTGASKVSNSLFSGNTSRSWSNQGSGGAIYAEKGTLALTHLTLVENSAPSYGSAIYMGGNSSATLVNSVLWKNSGGPALTGHISQSGNFDGPHDPLIDPESPLRVLTTHSPLRDLGGNNAAVSGATDLSGATRIFGAGADLGASEFQGATAEKVYLFIRPADQEVFVERTVSFSIRVALANPSLNTPVVWQYEDAGTWKAITGVDGWTTTVDNGVSTLSNPGVTQGMNGLKVRAKLTAVPDLAFPVKLTVKPRLNLYVDGRLPASGNGKSWPTAFVTIGEAFAVATADTDIWVASGDYAEANLVPPNGARFYIGFAGGETDLTQRDPVANPVRIGEPISDRTIIEGDTTVLIPPLPLAAGQTARWQVNRGAGMVDLSADANHTLSEVRGVPGLTIIGDTALSGHIYQVVYTTGATVDYVSLPAVITVIPRPLVYVDAAVTGGANNGSSWQNAFSSLSTALAAYPAFSDFRIAEGTYPAGSGGFVIRRGTVLRGGYVAGTETRDPVAHRTVLASASGAGEESAILTTATDRGTVDRGTVIDGLVFTGTGHGILLPSASPAILNCGFENLTVGLMVKGGDPRVGGSRFTGNRRQGIRVQGVSVLEVAQSTFHGNNSEGINDRTANDFGGAIQVGEPSSRNASTRAIVTQSTFTGNRSSEGSAIYAAVGSRLEVSRSTFTGNTTNRSTVVGSTASSVSIRQSLVAANTGGGIHGNGSLEVSFCTIAGNDLGASSFGVSIYRSGSLKNSIVWGNTGSGPASVEDKQLSHSVILPTLGANLIEGRRRLTGPMPSVDPRFVNAAAGDYRLAPDSPAIDRAVASDLLSGETDLAGVTRTTPDLGAYEAASATAPVYLLGLPASITAAQHTTVEISDPLIPANATPQWQFSTNGTAWTNITFNNVPGTTSATVTTPPGQYLTALKLVQITQPLNGISLRLVVTIAGQAHASPAIPVTVVPLKNLYVDAARPVSGDGLTWATAFRTLTEAIDATDDSHRIIQIAKGTYRPVDSFRIAALEIHGGWPTAGSGPRDPALNPTILSGLLAGQSGARAEVVVSITNGNFPSVLDGLVIENGGTGIRAFATSPVLRDLIVRGNNNGGLVLDGTNARVENSVFQNNSAVNGGAVRIISGQPVLERNILRDNTASANGGAIHIQSHYGSYRLISNLLTGNQADLGGGVYVQDSTVRADMNTFSGNHARLGGAVYSGGGRATLRNSIVWRNTATSGGANPELDGLYSLEGSFRDSDRTIVGNTTLTTGFLRFDPLFVSAATGNYQLKPSSPAIDRGLDSVASGLTLDLAGQPRFHGTVDLGAYESTDTAGTPLLVTGQPANLTYRRNQPDNTFHVSGTGAASVHWEIAPPAGEFTSLVGVPGFSGADTPSLVVTALAPWMNGHRVRAAFTGADGSVVYSNESILTVYSPRLYVDAARSGTAAGDGLTWATAFRTLDEAFAQPYDIEGTEIWVAKGTYQPASTLRLRPGAGLFGGFASGATSKTSRNLAADAVIVDGGGASHPLIDVTVDPYVSMTGDVAIDGITVANGSGYGIKSFANRRLSISGVSFTGLGTGLALWAGNTTVGDSTFSGNSVAIHGTSGGLTASRCQFRGNGGISGVPVVNIPSGTAQHFDNCLFAGNTTTSVSLGSTIGLLRHVTIVNNLGGSAVSTSQGVQIQNSVIWGNRTAGSANVPQQVSGETNGASVGNVIESGESSAAPVFVNPVSPALAPTTAGDYRPFGSSPIIEKGNNNYTTTLDLAGQPRLHGTKVDAGAYEYQSTPYFITSPVAAAGAPGVAVTYTVSGTSPLDATAWDESSDGGANWQPLAESSTYTGVTTNTLTVTGSPSLGGRLYRARLQFTGGPELPSDGARYDSVSLATSAVGYGTTAVFTTSASGSPTAYAWETAVGNGGFSTVPNDSQHTGATTGTLSVASNPSFGNRSYRVKVTFASGVFAFSNALAYPYTEFTSAPAGLTGGGTIGYGSTAFGFDLPGGVLASSLNDGSLHVHGAWSGLKSTANGGLLAPVISGGSVQLNFAQAPHAGEKISVTTTSALRRADGLAARPHTWQFRNGVRSGAGVFGPAAPLAGATGPATAHALADIDGDGDIDALVGGPSGITIYLNDGGGNLVPQAAPFGTANPAAIALGSVSGGSVPDAIVATAAGDLQVWSNNGSGAFTLASTATPRLHPRALAHGDLDSDGDLDIFAACASGNAVYQNDGTGHFSAPSATFAAVGSFAGVSVSLGDVDGDGSLDALAAYRSTTDSSTRTVLWRNRGNGTFDERSSGLPGADRVEIADLTGDSLPDLVTTRELGPTQVFKNLGNGNFQDLGIALGGGTATLAAGDVNGDGEADLVLTDAAGQLGTWTGSALELAPDQPAVSFGNRAELVDLDGDGALDLFGTDASGAPAASFYRVVASTGAEDTDLTLAAAGFTREGGEGTTHVRIASLPTAGTLLTAALAPVQVDQVMTLAEAAAMVYRPALDVFGFDSFTWQSSADGTTFGTRAIGYWIIIRPEIDNVVANADSLVVAQGGTATSLTGNVASVLANDTCADPGTLLASLVSRPAHGTLTLQQDGTFSYVHNNSETRSDRFIYQVKNTVTGRSDRGTVSIVITNVNDAPTRVDMAAGVTLYTGQPAGLLAGTLSAADPDPEDAGLLTFSLVPGFGDNAHFAITGNTIVTSGPLPHTPALTRSIRVRATDPGGLGIEKTLTLSLVRAPEAIAASLTTAEDTAVPFNLTGAFGNAVLACEIVTQPAHGTLQVNANSGSYTPARDYNGTDSFTFRVSDGTVVSAPVTVSIAITPVNDRPVMFGVVPPVTDEHTPVQITLSGEDVDGDPITFHIAQQGAWGNASISGNVLTYVPRPDAVTTVSADELFVYALDSHGLSSTDLSIRVIINPVNDAPVLAVQQTVHQILKGQAASFTATVTDHDSYPTSLVASTRPQHGTVTIGGDHSVSYRHEPGFTGTDTFTLRASDGELFSNEVTIQVTVTDPSPSATAASTQGDQGQAQEIFINGFDPQGDRLDATVVVPPTHGNATLYRMTGASYLLRYTPAPGFHGSDELSFTMTDPGGNVSAPAVVSITVNRVNLPPVAEAVTRSQSGLLANMSLMLSGSDPEGSPLTYRIVTPPSTGVLSGSGPNFVYTPSAVPFEGTDSFSYVVNDGEQDSAPAQVSLTFTRDVSPPSARADFATVYRGFSTQVDVVANDSDAWNNPLFVSDVTQPAHGTVTRGSTIVTYSHNGDNATDDQFTYTLSNFSGETTTETVFVTIRGHVITLTSLADSGPGTLREAVEVVNHHAGMSVAPDHTSRAEWTVQLPPVQVGSELSRDYVLDTIGDEDPLLRDSGLVVRGNVSFVSIGGGPVKVRRLEQGVPMRLMRVVPGATVALEGVDLHDGIAPQGGAILNQGNLTLRNLTLEGNMARSSGDDPGQGGAIYNRNGTVALDNVTLTENSADDGGGLYQVADGGIAHVEATHATFSGNTGNDFRSISRNGGQTSFHAVNLTAEKPTSPWVAALPESTIDSHFSRTLPVLLAAGESLSVVETLGSQPFAVSGAGSTRKITATFGQFSAQGPRDISIRASGHGVTFRRDARIILQNGADQAPIARDDHFVTAYPERLPLTRLALLNDEDPDGTELYSIFIQQGPSKGYLDYIQGEPYYVAYHGESGSDIITYHVGGGSNVATIHIDIVDRDSEIATDTEAGQGSLRNGIDLSNQYPSQPWMFRPSPDSDPVLELTTVGDSEIGDSAFLITGDVTIDGSDLPGFTIRRADRASSMRIFRVAPGGKLTLKNLSIENGSSALGGAIYNEGTVILDHATLHGSTATATSPSIAGLGGAVYNAGGDLSLIDSIITSNTAQDADETRFGLGGAIYTRNGQVTLTRSSLTENIAGKASGIYSEGNSGHATVTLTDSLFSNPTGRSEIDSVTWSGGGVTYLSTNTALNRVNGPFISTVKDTRVQASSGSGIREKLNFTINDLPGVSLAATSSIQDIVPDHGMIISTVSNIDPESGVPASDIGTDYARRLGVVPDRSGITTVHLIAGLDGVSFHQIFKLYVDTGVVSPPTAYPDVAEIYQGESVLVDVIDNDSDPYDIPLTITSVTSPSHGTATITADNKILYKHTGTTNPGTDEFFYTIDNGFGGTATMGTQIQFKSTAITVTSVYELDQALEQAANRPSLAWTITISAGSDQTWSSNGYPFDGTYYTGFRIFGNVTIDAVSSPGFTFYARPGGFSGPPTRLFSVEPGASLTLRSLRILGGTTGLYSDGVNEGGVGGAVHNRGNFAAEDVLFEQNSANDGKALGGAIYNNGGHVVITDSTFLDNRASGSTSFGGAIASRNGSLTLTGVVFTGNSASVANDVYVFGDGAVATVTVSDSNVTSYELRNFRGGSVIANGLYYAGDNADPVFSGYSMSTGYESPASIAFSSVLSHASDTPGEILVASGSTASQNGGSIIYDVSGFTYHPPSGFTGTDTFAITITDDRGGWVDGLVTVRVLSPEVLAGVGAETSLVIASDGKPRLIIETTPGRRYVIQRSKNLGIWIDLDSVTAGESGHISFTDDEPPTAKAFYRIKRDE